MKSVVSLLSFAYMASAATVNIANTDDAAAMLATAQAGDTVIFGVGEHPVAASLAIPHDLTIKGDAGAVLAPASDVEHVFTISKPNVKAQISGVGLKHRTTGTVCNLADPMALQANFSMAIRNPRIQNNKVSLEADLGYWYNTRYVSDIYFANCSYLADGPTADSKMTGYNWALYTDTCTASVFFSVAFNKLVNCGVGVDKTSDIKFVKYSADIEASMKEYVEKITPTRNLRVPVTRDGNAIARLRIQVDREGTVQATITINYPQAELQAVITKVGVKEVDGVNTSNIVITVNLPSPYTITGGSNGSLTLTDMNIPSANATNWVMGAGCDNLAVNEVCNSTFDFNITTCDLTGQYKALNVPIGCMPSAIAAGTCPSMVSNFADIEFFISTNNFCNVSEFNLSALFTVDVLLRTDNTYLADRPSTLFDLGAMSYWSLRIWTNATGVGLRDADVTKFVRTSDGDCAPYTAPYSDITTLTQTFMPALAPPEIQMPIPVTAALTCASAASTANNVTLTWTVLVDYLDSTARRRRREAQVVRREAGELETSNGFGVKYAPADIAQSNQVAGASGSGSNMTLILVAVGVAVVLLLFCCVCAGVGFVLYRRNKRSEEKEVLVSNAGFASASAAPLASSSADMYKSRAAMQM